MCKSDSAPQIKQLSKSSENNGKGQPGKDDFFWSYTEEPHATRRKEILAKYPQVKELFGHDPNFKYVVTLLVSIQIGMAYYMRFCSGWVFVLGAYAVGGTCNHMLMLAMHELSHNLGFKKMIHNRIFSLFANLPIGIPSAISFKRYHLEHHKYQGEVGVDVDIPTPAEGRIFQSTFMKFLFVMNQIFFYALRPLFVNPKKPGKWEFINAVCCIAFDAAILCTLGPWAMFYLILSTYLGAGLHPVAGHFIAEHYVFAKGAETYSYYGPLNIFGFNVGYHNEHHDFPNIPGSRLPELRRIAAEFYDPLPKCESWVMVLYNYITDPNISAFSRVMRHTLTDKEIAEIRKQ
ncbi:sphingolipid Delta-4 desaturase [Fistulifera solaris]|uniref:sphingolipid 4-desaturase n=1 Tax=Fistulifera solaris TaxID=1519565 RepID=A0A1Z5J9U8_FISSO|nr:sphingolipid Delta-4 desaturase [Fistulifera solaris]|eukprot:GAX10773.1 sphingolipid Delta-4 desaturase [Fistulifera solaris]